MNEEYIRLAQRALIVSFATTLRTFKKIATQKTYNSMRTQITKGTYITNIDLYAHKSLYFIEKGRRAGAKPPPISPIEEWIKAKNIQFQDKRGRNLSTKSMAFIISRSIGKKGIKPTPIIEKAESLFIPILTKIIKNGSRLYFTSLINTALKK
jgi:hypothetical protein